MWLGGLAAASPTSARGSALQCGLEFNQEGILGDVIPDAATGIVSRAQQHARLFASADGRLSIEVELTQRFNLVAVEFNSQAAGRFAMKKYRQCRRGLRTGPGS